VFPLIGPLTGPYLPVHLSKGGGHALTHALVKAATAYGVKILPCCPVDQILVEQGEVIGVKLSEHAVFPNETIRAKKIVSNLTVVPTFIDLIGEKHMAPEIAAAIKNFSYEEQNLFGVYYALSGQPQFASADYDDGIQRCCVGYFGGENSKEMKKFAENLVGRRIHDEIIANWFIPTLADPTQAPEGCHTSFAWVDVPPTPSSWIKGPLNGFKDWTRIKDEMADMVTDKEWKLPEEDLERVLCAMAYFANPEDLIPDRVPGIGFLDDAIMAELVIENLEAEISAYKEFCAFRSSEGANRGADVSREDWLADQRAALHARMRQRRRSGTGGWRVRLW